VYQQIYIKLKWLNAFYKINYIALQKLMRKFLKNYFVLQDNMADKKLQKNLEEILFEKRDEMKAVTKRLMASYAEKFTGNCLTKAYQELNYHAKQWREKDTQNIFLLIGMNIIILP